MTGRNAAIKSDYSDSARVEYAIHSRSVAFMRREENLISDLERNMEMNDGTYVSISGGKDSIVVAHAANKICPGVKMFSWMDDLEWPETIDLLNYCKDRLGWNVEIVMRHGLWDMIVDIGESPYEHNYFYDKRLIPDSRRSMCDGFVCNIMGLRAEESKARMKNAMARGIVYDRQGVKTLCPIQWWKGKDVFAYINKYDLPLHPNYKKRSLDFDISRIRVSWWIPFPAINRHGYANFLQFNYPEKYLLLKRCFG